MIAQNVCSSQNRKNLQFPASAHEEMEDAQVGDRELQTTRTEIRVRAPLRRRLRLILVVQGPPVYSVEPKSQPKLAH